MDKLDISKLLTIEDINNTPFEKYSEGTWVKHVTNSVAVNDLNRLVSLGDHPSCKYEFGWHMGDLHYRLKPNGTK